MASINSFPISKGTLHFFILIFSLLPCRDSPSGHDFKSIESSSMRRSILDCIFGLIYSILRLLAVSYSQIYSDDPMDLCLATYPNSP